MNNYFLGDLLKIKNGRDHKHLEDGKIPVFGSGGLMRYVNQSLYDDESILLPRKGSLSNIQYTKKPFWTVDTLYYTEIDKKKVEPYYLYHYLKRLDLRLFAIRTLLSDNNCFTRLAFSKFSLLISVG